MLGSNCLWCQASSGDDDTRPPAPDVLEVFLAQGVVAQQVRLTWRKGKQGRPLPACQHWSPSHTRSHDVCETQNPTRDTTHGGARLTAPVRCIANGRLRHMLIGYARVSKADGSQSLDLQRDALQAAGVDAGHVYHDVASGVRDDRPGLDSCVRALRPGDVLVVWKLDRLGRTLAHLVNTVQTLSASAASTMRAHASTSDPASW